nr:nucleoside-diphosphate sugar epimerase/dehydratase [Neobacillus citreus]
MLAILDSLIVITSIFVSMIIIKTDINVFLTPTLFFSILILLIFHHVCAFIYRLYHRAWAYASVGELIAITKAVSFSILLTVFTQLLFFEETNLRVLGITWMFHILLIGGSRFSWRIFKDHYIKQKVQVKRTLIVGAGSAGTMIARYILNNNDTVMKPIGYVDDDPKKINLDFFGLPMLGKISQIQSIVESNRIEVIIIAIPSLKKTELNIIFKECTKTKARVQIMPKIEDIMTGKVSVSSFRDVQVQDLLGREQVQLEMNLISEKLSGKTVLVTGAGGSIGSEISRQVCEFHPQKILLLGHGENSIYQIDMELRRKHLSEFEIIPIIADIQDRSRIFEVMREHHPDVVYHAAAHKHVPLMEYNPKESIKNNILGTKNVSEAAGFYGVDTFVLVSSDKAVNPTNVMGATKRCAELIIQELNQKYITKYVAVRFGNVLGSRGSVIPLFKKQIEEGGPITVTHPDMTRYFMTIPEASRLVIQAGALARGGEIFVLDMGEPVKIKDLAENLIKLSGYSIEEIGIEYTGIRPGEKMYEELLNENEVSSQQIFPKIHIGKAMLHGQEELKKLISEFNELSSLEVKERLLAISNVSKLRANVERVAVN